MENARCISLRILLYIRERWILILSVPSRERSTRTRTLARNSFGIVTNTNSLLSQHTRRIHDTAIMIQVVLGTPYGSTDQVFILRAHPVSIITFDDLAGQCCMHILRVCFCAYLACCVLRANTRRCVSSIWTWRNPHCHHAVS